MNFFLLLLLLLLLGNLDVARSEAPDPQHQYHCDQQLVDLTNCMLNNHNACEEDNDPAICEAGFAPTLECEELRALFCTFSRECCYGQCEHEMKRYTQCVADGELCGTLICSGDCEPGACAATAYAMNTCRHQHRQECSNDNDPVYCTDGSMLGPWSCDDHKFMICHFAEECCFGECKSEIQAHHRCLADNCGGCGAISCTEPDDPPPVDGGGRSSCFSASSSVQVFDRGPVQMKDLKVGDKVLTRKAGRFQYETMYAFGHFNEDMVGDFYVVTTKNNSPPLEITGDHLIYVSGKPNPVRADSLSVGDVLLSNTGPTQAVIESIGRTQKPGLYAPLTASGNLIVNDIVVSTYVALQESVEYMQIGLVGGLKMNVLPHQTFVHLTLAPFRMLCMGLSSTLCQKLDAEGIPDYIDHGMKFVHWGERQPLLLQWILLILVLPFFVAIFVLEIIFGPYSVAPVAALYVSWLLGMNMFSWKKKKLA